MAMIKDNQPRGVRWDIWFCVAGLIGGSLALGDIVLREAPAGVSGKRPHDFAHYYVAARRVLRRENPYSPVAVEVEQLLGFRDYAAPVADTPAMLSLLAPLGWLSYRTAWLLFAVGSVLTTAGSAAFVCRVLRLNWFLTLGAAGAVLMSRPFRQSLYYNHAEWLVLAAAVIGWHLARRGKPVGGALWGLAAAIKLFPGMLLVSSLLGRQWRASLWIAIGGCLFTLLGTAAVGWQPTCEFITIIVPNSKVYYTWSGNASLMAIGTVLSGGVWGGYVLTGAGLALAMACLWRHPGGIDRAYATGMAAALMISPLSWIYYGTLVFPPLILIGARRDWNRASQRVAFIALATVLLFWPLAMIENLPLTLPTFLAQTLPRLVGYATLFVWSLRALD